MACPTTPNLHDNLVDWSVTISMYGSYQASVRLINQDATYTIDQFLWKPFQVNLNTTGLAAPGIDSTCFNGDGIVIYGVVVEVEETVDEINSFII